MAFGPIEFEGGNVVMDKDGNVNLKKGHILGNDSFRGSAVIKSGQTSIQITQTTNWDSLPVSITLTPGFDTKAWVTNKTTSGFTINVSTPPTSDTTIDWLAVW